MSKHWKAIVWALIVAMTAFVISVMVGKLMLTFAVIVSAFIFLTAYFIAVGQFHGRQDAEDAPKHGGARP